MRSISEVGRIINFVEKAVSIRKRVLSALWPEYVSPRAPAGTNAFFLPFAGTNIQGIGHGSLVVNQEQCREGVCVDILYDINDENGDRVFLKAHVRADDSLEDGYAFKQIDSNPYQSESLDFDSTLELFKERLTALKEQGESPQVEAEAHHEVLVHQ